MRLKCDTLKFASSKSGSTRHPVWGKERSAVTTKTQIEILVRSTEIDVNGHVNNAKYLEYLEWGREDWYEQLGLDYQTLKDMDIVTVVAHISADYKAEAIQNDRLRIITWLDSVRNTSMTMKQTINNQHDVVVLEATVVIVTVSASSHEKIRVPDQIRSLV
nr:thioesterase family protein [Alicyclobacillus ferrooxydans]